MVFFPTSKKKKFYSFENETHQVLCEKLFSELHSCLSFCLNTLYSLRALKPGLRSEHSPGACRPSLPFVCSTALPLHKEHSHDPVTAFRFFPHFKLCKEFGGLDPRRNQRAPKAALLNRACCVNADLLFRNSSWTISCYLKVTTQFQQWTAHSREVLGRIKSNTSHLLEWCKLLFSWPELREESGPAQLETTSFSMLAENCPANPKHCK